MRTYWKHPCGDIRRADDTGEEERLRDEGYVPIHRPTICQILEADFNAGGGRRRTEQVQEI